MHINHLMNHLKASFGEPAKLDRQNAFRWEILRGRYPIHLCVTLDDRNARAVIWVFDPHNPEGLAQSIYLNDQEKLDEVLKQIRALIPADGLTRAAQP